MMRNPRRKARHALVCIILAGLMLAATACASTSPTTFESPTEPPKPPAAASDSLSGTLSGTVTYLQRIALAPDAVVEVTLQDVSRADAPAEVISTQTIATQDAQVPITYSLKYDPGKIDAKNTYAVRATITEGGNLTWMSTKRHPVLTRGTPVDNVEIIVEQVPQTTAAVTPDPATLPAPTGVLTGTVTYLQRIALPPDAVIDVQLQDVSLQDVPATVIAAERYVAAGRQVPFPFELTYDPAGIIPQHTYAVATRITVNGKLRWINTQHYPVLTGGAPVTGVEIIVESVGGGAGMKTLSDLNGTVAYLQRIALPPNAIIEVSLQDVSKADAPAEVLDSVKIPSAGRQVPIPFTLHYDAAQIDERYTYTVSARITVDGVLTWISKTQNPVLTRGAPTDNVEITVEQVAQ
jgi:uncharacterized lipoprotein YbaY